MTSGYLELPLRDERTAALEVENARLRRVALHAAGRAEFLIEAFAEPDRQPVARLLLGVLVARLRRAARHSDTPKTRRAT